MNSEWTLRNKSLHWRQGSRELSSLKSNVKLAAIVCDDLSPASPILLRCANASASVQFPTDQGRSWVFIFWRSGRWFLRSLIISCLTLRVPEALKPIIALDVFDERYARSAIFGLNSVQEIKSCCNARFRSPAKRRKNFIYSCNGRLIGIQWQRMAWMAPKNDRTV